MSSQGKVTINLNNLNDNAPRLDNANFTINGIPGAGDVIGTLNISDADGDISTFTISVISGNESGIFEIDEATGEIIVNKPELIDYTSSDTLTVRLSISDGENEMTADIVIAVSVANDIINHELSQIIKAYPIPATSVAYISSEYDNIQQVKIISMNGRVIKFIDAGDSRLVEIDVEWLLSGMYFFEVTTQNGSIKIIQFIKQ